MCDRKYIFCFLIPLKTGKIKKKKQFDDFTCTFTNSNMIHIFGSLQVFGY